MAYRRNNSLARSIGDATAQAPGITFSDLVNHPYSFAVGVGLANGLLAVGRGKKIDAPTALTLSVILGLGEMALVAFEPPEERPMDLATIGVYSVLGVLTGVIPFVTSNPHESTTHSLPMATNTSAPSDTAVSGWARNGRRARRRG